MIGNFMTSLATKGSILQWACLELVTIDLSDPRLVILALKGSAERGPERTVVRRID
jgi:hypothetical protein